ncbi:hypothetical protein BJ165DRAFT_1534958 [Panaeolus papilionaceus]|nr:hypothetical protein BJ165DRAFT_1534958 [Panaeolus papilionaceus]
MTDANSNEYFFPSYSFPPEAQSTSYNHEYTSTHTAPRLSNQLDAALYHQLPILPNENNNDYHMTGEYGTKNAPIYSGFRDRNAFTQPPNQHVDVYADPGGLDTGANSFAHRDATPIGSPAHMLTQQMYNMQFGSPHVSPPSYSLMQQGGTTGANCNANIGVFTPNFTSPLGTPLTSLDPTLIYNPTQNFHQLASDNLLSESLYRVDTKQIENRNVSRVHHVKGMGDAESQREEVADKIIKIMDEVEVPLDEQEPPRNLEKQILILNKFIRSIGDRGIRDWLESARAEVGTPAGKRIARDKRRRGATTRLHYCIWCHNTLTSKNNLANHVRSHLKLHLSSCPNCGLSTVNRRLPTRHKCMKKEEPSTSRQRPSRSYNDFQSPPPSYWQGPPSH